MYPEMYSKVSVCSECGREIREKFRFCPWCGKACNKEMEISNFAEHIETVKSNQRKMQIERAQERLEELKEELNVLVLQAQLAN